MIRKIGKIGTFCIFFALGVIDTFYDLRTNVFVSRNICSFRSVAICICIMCIYIANKLKYLGFIYRLNFSQCV